MLNPWQAVGARLASAPAPEPEADVTFFASVNNGNTAADTIGVPAGSAGKLGVFVAAYYNSTDLSFTSPAMTPAHHMSISGWDAIIGGRVIGSDAETQTVSAAVTHILCVSFSDADALLSVDANVASAATSFVFPAQGPAPHDGCRVLEMLLFSGSNSDTETHSNPNAIRFWNGTNGTLNGIANTGFPGRRAYLSPPLAQGETWGGGTVTWTDPENTIAIWMMLGRAS